MNPEDAAAEIIDNYLNSLSIGSTHSRNDNYFSRLEKDPAVKIAFRKVSREYNRRKNERSS